MSIQHPPCPVWTIYLMPLGASVSIHHRLDHSSDHALGGRGAFAAVFEAGSTSEAAALAAQKAKATPQPYTKKKLIPNLAPQIPDPRPSVLNPKP